MKEKAMITGIINWIHYVLVVALTARGFLLVKKIVYLVNFN
jgi:hypothetical protein